MVTKENPHSGQGAVVLNIGGDIGALVVAMPSEMADVEVEIVPTGEDARVATDVAESGAHHHAGPHSASAMHRHDGQHGVSAMHEHDSWSAEEIEHSHPASSPPHVAVVGRQAPDGSTTYSLVFGELSAGTYDLYVRPDGPVRLTATVVGGQVTRTRWPETALVS